MVRLLNVVFLVVLWWGVWWGGGRLAAGPGTPDSWYLLPLLGTGLVALTSGLARALPRWPELLNIPRKEEVMALTPEERDPVFREAALLIHVTNTHMLLLFGIVQILLYREALELPTGGWVVAVLLVAVLGGAVIAGTSLVRLLRVVDRVLEGGA